MASEPKFSSKITFNNNNVDSGAQLLSDKAIAVLEIPQEILIYWHRLKDKNSVNTFAVTDCRCSWASQKRMSR